MEKASFNPQVFRNDFPILNREVNGNPLVYFDNAATSQTPQQVIDAIVEYYSKYNAKYVDSNMVTINGV